MIVSVPRLPPGLEEMRARGIQLAALQLGIDPRLRRDAPWLLGGVKARSYAGNMAAWEEGRRPAGVTRPHLRTLAGEEGFAVEEGWYPVDRLARADEVFTSSSVREIMPVVAIDGRPVRLARPGRAPAPPPAR